MLRGHIVFNPDFVLLIGSGLVTRPHRHLSASVTLSLDGTFQFRAGRSSASQPARLVAMRPDTLHSVDARDARIINLQIDPETAAYARLRGSLLANDSLVVRDECPQEWVDTVRALTSQRPLVGQRVVGYLLDALGSPPSGKIQFDRRVAQALALLKSAFPDAPSGGEIAARVGLSESRLSHLFREQVGVPLRRYTLWLRIRHIFFCVATGQNLTDAAHEAGFADSSHLSRVFADMFGIPASSLVRSDQVTRSFELPEMPLRGPHAEQDAARLQTLLGSDSQALRQPAVARSRESR